MKVFYIQIHVKGKGYEADRTCAIRAKTRKAAMDEFDANITSHVPDYAQLNSIEVKEVISSDV